MSRRIAIAGSSGFIGTHLVRALRAQGDTVLRLVRRTATCDDEVCLQQEHEPAVIDALEGLDAVVHLGGAGIADKRWTRSRRQELIDSRVSTTQHLATVCTLLQLPPRVFVQASAIGLYGHRGDEQLDETSSPGIGFLPQLAKAWEAAGTPFDAVGRRCMLRFGLVLARDGGALAKMLPLFKAGFGGRLGPGTQWMSWISLADTLSIIDHAIQNSRLKGPINVVTPTPVPNATFTRVLGGVLRRPTCLPAPAIALRCVLGAMANDLLLCSQRVVPKVLETAQFTYQHPTLEVALRALLKS